MREDVLQPSSGRSLNFLDRDKLRLGDVERQTLRYHQMLGKAAQDRVRLHPGRHRDAEIVYIAAEFDADVREQHISVVEQAFGKEARGGAPYRQTIRLARTRGLDDLLDELPRANEIGRASGRERVCQYV